MQLVAHVLTALYLAGAIPSTGTIAVVVAIVATQLTSLGYQVNRTALKKAANVASMLLVVIAVGACSLSCSAGSTVRKDAAVGVVSVATCEASGLTAADAEDSASFAANLVKGWISGVKPGDQDALKAKVKADLTPLKGKLWPCLIAGAVATFTSSAAPTTRVAIPDGATSGVGVPGLTAQPADLRVAFQLAARELGWPPIQTNGGAL